MILVKREDVLPAAVQIVKKEVLLCLRAVHMLHEYDGLADLTAFLDEAMAAARIRKLNRALLFYSDPYVRLAVEGRMNHRWGRNTWPVMFGDNYTRLVTFVQPGCWMRFQPQLPELRKWADRYEPGFVASEMAKD